MSGYSTKDVADLLNMPASRVRTFAREGFVEPSRDTRGRMTFSFQDIVLMRAAQELTNANVPVRSVFRALRLIRNQLPSGRPLSTVRIAAEGARVVVRDKDIGWEPESGQETLNFDVSELAREAAPLVRRNAEQASVSNTLSSDAYYDIGLDCEMIDDAARAELAYRRALDLDPGNSQALSNLGRLRHKAGALGEAIRCYRRALEADPDFALASFNLGVALEDAGEREASMRAYKRAIALAPDLADAHFNLARLYEASGDRSGVIRHLARYRALT